MTQPEAGRNDALAAFVQRLQELTDDERLEVAAMRGTVAEGFHEAALRAAAEALVGRGEEYVLARRLVSTAHVPSMLLDDQDHGGEEIERWTEIARLVQLAIDEMLVMIVTTDLLHPDDLRELSRPWSGITREPSAAST